MLRHNHSHRRDCRTGSSSAPGCDKNRHQNRQLGQVLTDLPFIFGHSGYRDIYDIRCPNLFRTSDIGIFRPNLLKLVCLLTDGRQLVDREDWYQ
jgi:hypothetical protein